MKKAYRCGFCGAVIFLHNEVRGMLHVENGVPMCVRCRVLKKSRIASKIRADKKNFEKDKAEIEHRAQMKANEKAIELAYASQKKHKDDMITK
jgi:hypothetical protein